MAEKDSRGRERVTIDTGTWSDVWPGSLVTWLHTPRGGYGFIMPVGATVTKVHSRASQEVTIEFVARSGRVVQRVVPVDSLRRGGTGVDRG